MIINIHKDVQELLTELNEIGPSIIFGGYLRDLYLDRVPNDVDIVTNITIEVLEQKYSGMEKAKRRVTTSGHDVFSFKLERTEKIFIEIVSTTSDIMKKSEQADYTINSLMYGKDGLIDSNGFFNDVRSKIIREVDANVITEDLKIRPYLWLKTLRLVSMTGFYLSDKTFEILNRNKSCIYEISDEIMQTEGHKTLNGIDPFKAMGSLTEMGLLPSFVVENYKEQRYSIQPQQQLCLLAVLASKELIDEYCKLYRFRQDLIDKYHRLYEMYNSNERPPSRFKNQLITIKKIVERGEM